MQTTQTLQTPVASSRFGVLHHAQRGQGMTEYIIIVALIAVAAIGAFTYFGQTIRSQMAGIAKEVSGEDASTQINAAKAASEKANAQANTAKGLGSYRDNQPTAGGAAN